MSDDNGDAPFEDAVPPGPTGGGGVSVDGRLDSISRGLETLGTRVDALVTSTTTYRSALTDRLTEYSNLVAGITRNHASQLEEYRQANEHAVAELRHSLAASEDVLTRVGQRIDDLVDQGGSPGAPDPVLDELRSIRETQEQLRRTLQESLDRFGERLATGQPDVGGQLERIERELDSSAKVAAESWGELAGLRAKVDAVLQASTSESGAVSAVLDELREALLDVASGEVVGALWDEFRTARESLDTLVARSEASTDPAPGDDPTAADQTDDLRNDVVTLTSAIRELLAQAEVVDTEDDDAGGLLADVASDITALRGELSEGLVVEPSEALAGTVDQLRAELSGLDERMRSITDLRDDVAALRAAAETAGAAPDRGPDAIEVAIAADVTALHDEVAKLRVATETIAASTVGMDSLRSGLDEINDRLAAASDDRRPDEVLAVVASDLTSLRAEVAQRFDRLADEPAGGAGITDADVEGELRTLRTGVEGVDAEIRILRSGIEDIIGRLDEGLVLADDITPPATAAPEISDEFATLRDQVTTEFDALRQLLAGVASRPASEAPQGVDIDLSPLTELLEHVRDDLAELPVRIQTSSPSAADGDAEYAAIDPDTIDLLREEIRAAGGVSEGLLDALRNDLVALRRRIKLRAEGELFTDEQLDRIADAVARRLDE